MKCAGPVAQRLEQQTNNLLVLGSNPSGPTNRNDGERTGLVFLQLALCSLESLHASLSEANRWSAIPSDFETTSLIPAARAAFRSCSSLCMVNITIAVFGATTVICRAAASPSISGICKSRITMSGCSSLTFSTATLPSSASPQTLQSGSCSRQDRSDWRMRALSSTIRIVWDKTTSNSLRRVLVVPHRAVDGQKRRNGGKEGQLHPTL